MKTIAAICLSLLLFSCINKDRETVEMDQLNRRIILLEQRIDSLIRNANSIRLNNTNSPNTASHSTLLNFGRCQAITKKGTQCKRKAKNNSYCWQHGG